MADGSQMRIFGMAVGVATIVGAIVAVAQFVSSPHPGSDEPFTPYVTPPPDPTTSPGEKHRKLSFNLLRCEQPSGGYEFVAQALGSGYVRLFQQKCPSTTGAPVSGDIRLKWHFYSEKNAQPGAAARNDHLQVVEDSLGSPSILACLRGAVERHSEAGLPPDQDFDVDCSFGVWSE